MRIKQTSFFAFIFIIAATTVAANETILFKNGDILTGKVIQQDDQKVSFQSATLGTIELKKSTIKEIKAEEKLAKQSEPKPIVASEKPKATPKKKKQWSGQSGLSIAMRQSDTTRLSNGTVVEKKDSYETYRIYGHINWKGKKNNLNWKWTYRYSEDETRKRDDFLNLTQKYNHTFQNKSYYAEAKTIYQRDYNRQIENEYLQTAEIGKKWFNRPKFSLSTSVGGGYHQYDRTYSDETICTKEPKLVLDQSIRWKMINSLTLFQKYTHLGDFENYHFIFTAGLENKLIQNLFLRMEYRLDRDTEIAYDDKGYNDKALLTSLLYKF